MTLADDVSACRAELHDLDQQVHDAEALHSQLKERLNGQDRPTIQGRAAA
jgi:hypothetical protein